jgi:hypothetical protein
MRRTWISQVKEALEKTLVTAQLQSEEMRANAHKERELILRDAEMKARSIVSDSYGETQEVQQTLVQLKLLEEDFRFKFRSLLEGYMKLLEEVPISAAADATPPAPSAAAIEVAPEITPESPEVAVGPVVAPQEDDTPTEETDPVIARVSAAVDAYVAAETERASAGEPAEEATEETTGFGRAKPVAVPAQEEEPAQGFFFGRQTDDFDGTFTDEDAIKTDKTRDFEW